MATDEFRDRVAALRDRLDAGWPEAWMPEQPGDEIAGYFVRLDQGRTSFGEAHIVVLDQGAGHERAIWLLHTVLRNEFAKLRPVPGELVLIRYEGKKDPAGGRGSAYDSYKVTVDRTAEGVRWEDVGAESLPTRAPEPDPGPPDRPPPADDDIPF